MASLNWENVAAQNDPSYSNKQPSVQQLHKIKLSIFGLTYQWEKPISRKSVFTAEGGLAGGLAARSDMYDGTDVSYVIVPSIGVGFRNYYNLDRRYNKGKNIANNAANFIAVDINANSEPILYSDDAYSDAAVGITAAWGMQRNLSRKINFEWQVGVTAGTNFDEATVYPNLRIGFSFLPGAR